MNKTFGVFRIDINHNIIFMYSRKTKESAEIDLLETKSRLGKYNKYFILELY